MTFHALHRYLLSLLFILGSPMISQAQSDGGTPDAGPPAQSPPRTLVPAQAPESQGLMETICAWLGMACDSTLATVRSNSPVRDAHAPRASLALYDISKQSESIVISDCGNCRTPVALDKRQVAFANVSGVFVAQLSGTTQVSATMRVKMSGVKALLGTQPGNPKLLLAVVEGQATQAQAGGASPLRLQVIDLEKGTASPFQGADRDFPLEAIPALRPGQVREGVALVVENNGMTQRKAPFDKGGNWLLHQRLRRDGAHRVDPIWLTDNQVLYVRVR
jgi:hypothetical protein